MSEQSWDRMKDLFGEAIEKTGAEREEFLKGLDAEGEGLREEFEELLAAHERADEAERREQAGEKPGDRIGNYKLLQEIGQGGFGIVYMAEQEQPVRRKVALKIIKLGMDTKQVIARFEAERQALAVLDHPGIATVFDAGATETGRPYFAMELVRGMPITKFCDSESLETRDRLSLFIDICHAIQHAHTKGIIHRDLKPSNILVTLADGRPIIKIIDFGIAKATDQRLTERTLFTEFRQMVGTPDYMAPEQAEMSALDVDTRADIYSLGVLLYELLTSTRPFDMRTLLESGYDEMIRCIREIDPPKPSTRVRTLGESGTTVAKRRRTDVRQLGGQLKGDLDWVVMKALEKDRSRRYETATAFAQDIQRYLSDEPVSASPPSATYVLRKFVRRHRVGFAAGTLALASLLAGLIAAVSGYISASRSAEIASNARTEEASQRVQADDARLVAEKREAEAVAQRDRADQKSEELRRELYSTRIERIHGILESDGRSDLGTMLEECDPDLRGWEWYRLQWLSDRSTRTLEFDVVIAHPKFSDDGSRFLVVHAGGVVIHDSESWRVVGELGGKESAFHQADFGDGDTRVATSHADGTVRVWDLASEKVVRELKVDGVPTAIAFSSSGEYVVVGTTSSATTAFRSSTGEKLFEVAGPARRASQIVFTENEGHAIVGSLNNDVTMIRMVDGAIHFSERGSSHVVRDLALSPDGTRLVSVGGDARLWMRNAASGELLFTQETNHARLFNVAYHPSGDLIFTTGTEGVLAIRDSASGDKIGSLRSATRQSNGLAVHPDGRSLLDVRGKTLKEFRLGMGGPFSEHHHYHVLQKVSFSPDGRAVLFGGNRGGLMRLSLDTLAFEEPRTVADQLRCVEQSPDGRWIGAIASDAGPGRPTSLTLLDASLRAIRTLDVEQPHFIEFAPDSQSFLLRARDGMTVRDVRRGEILAQLPSGYGQCHFLADGRIVAVTDDSFVVHDLSTKSVTTAIDALKDPIGHVVLNSSRSHMAARVKGGRVDIYELTNFERIGSIESAPEHGFALSPDGRRLVTGGGGGVRLWNTAGGGLVMQVGKHPGSVTDVAFSNDGRTIASVCNQHRLRIWETGPPPNGPDARYDEVAYRWNVGEAARRRRTESSLELTRSQVASKRVTASKLRELAELLITCEFEDLRSPDEALEFARRANDMTGDQNPLSLTTLAMAEANTGNRARAIELQRRALTILPPELEDARPRMLELLGELLEHDSE